MTALQRARDELRENGRQWDAFSTSGHCVVLAPPGSGKTKLLTTRLAEDALTRIRFPFGAACITLTNPAADELRRRIIDLAVPSGPSLFIGTVHSFALARIVRPFAGPTGQYQLLRMGIASEQQQRAAFNDASRDVYGDHGDRYLRSTMDRARRMMATAVEIQKMGPRMRRLIQVYERTLSDQMLIDFDGIITKAVQLVERHPFVQRILRKRYVGIYVDEYQDLAPGLDHLVRALCLSDELGPTLFAVGDPDQAIYGFTGTRPELLHQLTSEPNVTTVRLNVNYRCANRIILVSRRLLDGDRDIVGVAEGGVIVAHECPDGFEDQCERAADVVNRSLADHVPLEQIALMCPTHYFCGLAAEHLRGQGIPVFVRGEEYRLTGATFLLEGLAAWVAFPVDSGFRLGDLIRRWRSLLGTADDYPRRIQLVTLLLATRKEKQGSAAAFVKSVLRLGLAERLKRQEYGDDAQEVAKLLEALNSGSLADITVRELGERARPKGRVEITTMTASKGLEFDVVLLMCLEEGLIPFWAATAPDELAEERRKFYVSITRARQGVHLFYSGWFQWASGTVRQEGPSRFLTELRLHETE